MQNKSAIRVFAILLVLASLYSLSFNFFTANVESTAKEIADGNVEVENDYLDSMKTEKVYPVLGYTYGECKEKELNFGLDLKGGMNVTLEISVVDLLKALSKDEKDTMLLASIKKAELMQENAQEDFVTLFCDAFKQLYPNEKLVYLFYSSQNKDFLEYDSSDDEVKQFLLDEANGAIENSFNVLRTRIDKFGVVQPNIQDLGGGKILVELPGVKDKNRVRELLQSTAKLEFYNTYKLPEVYQLLQQINDKVKEINQLSEVSGIVENSSETNSEKVDSIAVVAKEDTASNLLVSGLDSSSVDKDSTESSLLNAGDLDKEESPTGMNDIERAKQFPLFSKLQLSVDGKGNLQESAMLGYVALKDTADINKYLSFEQVKRLIPRNMKFLWSVKGMKDNPDYFTLYAIEVPRDGKAPLDGDAITNASVDYGQTSVSAGVSLRMDADGAKTWARMTREAAKTQDYIAIVLDNYVYSCPVVNEEIPSGSSRISGDFSQKEAKDLENVLKSGKLPAPARIIEEVVVGPSLGHESVNAGVSSFILALIIVLLYMVFYYKKAGVVANIALLLNMVLIIGVLSSLQAVLTLPGIAGIVLTIGMSVDANVLIFERVREEMAQGKGMKLAITDGYKQAYSAIIDANVTTLLTGIILATFGTGPIQGFATTLIIGIVTSLFCAIFITRLIFERMLEKKSDITFDTKLTRNAFKNTNIDFIGKRKLFYVISSVAIIVSIISISTKHFDLGIDFKGGRNYDIKFSQEVDAEKIREVLKDAFGEAPQVKTQGSTNTKYKITTDFMISDKSTSADSIVDETLFKGLKPILGDNVTKADFSENYIQSSQKVGPTIADDIVYGAAMAIFFSLLLIFLYIFIRFRNWKYGLGAIAALAHDVLLVLGIFSIFYGILPFSMEIDQAFIAAILTVIGYSINDTVVVFDRIRELNFNRKNLEKNSLFNIALNSTMSRTFSTSLSTFVVLLTIFLLGGDTIRGFVFAMMIGVIVGTYSSLFIASPVVFDADKKEAEIKK